MHDNPPLKCVGYGWILKDPRHARYALTKALRHIVRHTQMFAAYALCPKANGKVSCRAIRTGTLPRRGTTLTLAAPWHSLSRRGRRFHLPRAGEDAVARPPLAFVSRAIRAENEWSERRDLKPKHRGSKGW